MANLAKRMNEPKKRYDKYEAMILTPDEEKAAIYEAKKVKWFRINRGLEFKRESTAVETLEFQLPQPEYKYI